MEKVVVHFDMPGMTSSQYDQIWQDLRAMGHENPKGLVYHVGAATANGWMVVDVWESAGHFNEFGKTLMPILVKNGTHCVASALFVQRQYYELIFLIPLKLSRTGGYKIPLSYFPSNSV